MMGKTCYSCKHFVNEPFQDKHKPNPTVGACLDWGNNLGENTIACLRYEGLVCYTEAQEDKNETHGPIAAATRETTNEPMWHLLPFQALNIIAKVLTAGAKKCAPRNWEKGLPITSYLNHAMIHIGKYILSETCWGKTFDGAELEQEDHLAHAACNLMMALETRDRVLAGVLSEELMALGGE